MFLDIFCEKLKKFKKYKIFQKFSLKSGVSFFFDFLNINSQTSRKQLDIFFRLFLLPSEHFLRHHLRKNKKKTIFKFFKKFRTSQFLAIFRKFSILKGIPYKKNKGISFVKFKGISFDRQKYFEFLFILTDFGGFDFSNADFQI